MSKPPNFLVIMADQHAPDTIGAHGHPIVETPALDRLAGQGISFTSAYCPYPMCTPSRDGLMTGQRTPQHGVWELGTPLGSDVPTWAHVLRTHGYQTAISGRMHFIGHDKMHGFERRVSPDVGDMLVPFTYGNWDRAQADDHVMLGAIAQAAPSDGPTGNERYDDRVFAAAQSELERLAAGNSEQPWALMVGAIHPHFPYRISKPFFDRYESAEIPLPRVPPGEAPFADLVPPQLHDNRKWLGLTSDGATEEQVRTARRCYYAMITCLDAHIGRLTARLEALGLADNTWVVYVSDHGDNMGEHGFWSKLNFFEDSVRIPFIVAPPRCERAGEVCTAPVSLVDWMPTVLELTGDRSWAESLPGRSIVPLLNTPTETWPDRAVISDYACDGTRVPMRMVRYRQWKASFAPGFAPVLFDLSSDPHEWHDLGAAPGSREILSELEAIAREDGWNPEGLQNTILTHKRRLSYIEHAETGRER